jgi:hypothetical protein
VYRVAFRSDVRDDSLQVDGEETRRLRSAPA